MTWRWRKPPACVLVTLAALAAAIGILPAGAQPGRAIGVAVHGQIIGAADAIAVRQGYFKQEGIEVRSKPVALSSEGREAMASGAVDIDTRSVRTFLFGLDRGGSYIAIAINSLTCGATHVAVRADSGIRDVAQLKGKRVGLPRNNIIGQVFVSRLAPAHGLKPADYSVTTIADPKARVPNLVVKVVDAAVAVEPAVAAAEQAGTVKSIESFCAYDPLPYVVVASAKAVKERPDVVVAYLRGRLRAIKLLREEPAKAAAVYADEMKGLGWDVSASVLDQALRRMNWQPEITPEIQRYFAARITDLQAATGEARLNAAPDLSKAIDTGLLVKASRPR